MFPLSEVQEQQNNLEEMRELWHRRCLILEKKSPCTERRQKVDVCEGQKSSKNDSCVSHCRTGEPMPVRYSRSKNNKLLCLKQMLSFCFWAFFEQIKLDPKERRYWADQPQILTEEVYVETQNLKSLSFSVWQTLWSFKAFSLYSFRKSHFDECFIIKNLS